MGERLANRWSRQGKALRDLVEERYLEARGEKLNVSALGDAMGVAPSNVQHWFAGASRMYPASRAKLIEAAESLGMRLTLADIAQVYGEPVPPQRPLSLAEAIKAQADAIRDLVVELRESRLAQVSATTVVFEALGALGVRPGPEGTQDDTEHEVPAGTPR